MTINRLLSVLRLEGVRARRWPDGSLDVQVFPATPLPEKARKMLRAFCQDSFPAYAASGKFLTIIRQD